MDLLGKYELVRVRLPDGLDKWKATRALERLLDCVCVHQIGFTCTLYRHTKIQGKEKVNLQAAGTPPALIKDKNTTGARASWTPLTKNTELNEVASGSCVSQACQVNEVASGSCVSQACRVNEVASGSCVSQARQ
eukprot:1158607-Pelagomonas_calceolata.AAC.1